MEFENNKVMSKSTKANFWLNTVLSNKNYVGRSNKKKS